MAGIVLRIGKLKEAVLNATYKTVVGRQVIRAHIGWRDGRQTKRCQLAAGCGNHNGSPKGGGARQGWGCKAS